MDVLKAILDRMGVAVAEVGEHSHLRADLGLDSTETTELELELARLCERPVDLWDARDYTLGELATLLAAPNRPHGAT